MKKNTLLTRLFIVALLCFVVPAFADEEPKRGTLPDGRAFRTDDDGNQLVDYIAELEVNVDTLEKRVYGLEDEVKEKQAAIERLQKGGSVAPKFQESDISPAKSVSHEVVREACPTCPRCEDRSADLVSLNSALTDAKVDAAQAKAQLSQVRIQLQQERESRSREVASYETAMQEMEGPAKNAAQQVAALSKELDKARRQLESEQEVRSQKVAEVQTALQIRTSELQSKDQEIASLQDRLQKLQLAQAKTQMKVEAQEVLASNASTTYRANMAPPAVPQRVPSTGVVASAGVLAPPVSSGLNAARERALGELRSDIAAGLARLRMGIQTRDSLFLKFDQRGRALQIKPSPLRTARNATPESVARDAGDATTVRALAQIRQDIRELELRVNDDISVVRRMSGKK